MSVEEQKIAVLKLIKEEYDSTLSAHMAHLYNQFTAFIAQSQVPLPHVITVLALLQKEAIEQASQGYLGK